MRSASDGDPGVSKAVHLPLEEGPSCLFQPLVAPAQRHTSLCLHPHVAGHLRGAFLSLSGRRQPYRLGARPDTLVVTRARLPRPRFHTRPHSRGAGLGLHVMSGPRVR